VVRRALKILADREVTPQTGLLKSTLLQLDSTFSEREYGAGSFRDFMEKVAKTGAVTLRNAGRSMMVESREDGDVEFAAAPQGEPATPQGEPAHADGARPVLSGPPDDDESLPQSPMTMQDGIHAVQHAFAHASPAPRWPMYVRQAKQFLKTHIEAFDERKYGFASVVDLLRAAGKEGVLRVERDRHGAVRIFQGQKLSAPPPMPDVEEMLDEAPIEAAELSMQEDSAVAETVAAEVVEEPPIVDGQAIEEPQIVEAVMPAKRGGRKRKAAAPKPKTAKASTPSRRTRRPASTKSVA